MVSSLLQAPFATLTACDKLGSGHKKLRAGIRIKPTVPLYCAWSPCTPSDRVIQKCVPLVASVAILLCSYPAKAGFLSGSTGIESIPGPELPKMDFLTRFNEENQKKYAEFDARFKESPLLKQLLERSKLNKEKNKQEISDKYCIRGAEWGVGDCSAEGMTPDERDKFISMLKEKAGVK